MKPFNLPSLSAFVEVARHRSFTRAAATLGVSPTALSKSLQRLENAVGVRLLNRTTKAVQLTAEGALLLDQIAPAMTAIGQALDSLNNPEKDVQGTLRITVPTVAYSLLLERHIADFLHRYPMLQLEMLIEDALVDIVSAGLDAGIRLGERLALDMVATPLLRTERMAVVAAPSYLSGRPPIESPADLLQHECIRFRLKTNGTLYPWTLTIGGESRAVDVEGRLVLNSMPAVLNAAIGGCGVACGSRLRRSRTAASTNFCRGTAKTTRGGSSISRAVVICRRACAPLSISFVPPTRILGNDYPPSLSGEDEVCQLKRESLHNTLSS